MTRQINKEGRDKLKGFEALRLKAYLDVGGVWTIGWGHIKTAKAGMKITEVQAEALLALDLKEYEVAVEKYVKVPLSDNQFATLVSFAYNVGIGAFMKSTLLKKLNAGQYDAVPSELMKWNKVKGKTVRGLTNRRAAEAGMWAKGEYVSSRPVQPTKAPQTMPTLQKVGNGLAGASAAAATAVEQLTPYAAYSDVIKQALVVLVIVGVALTIYSTIRKNKEEAA